MFNICRIEVLLLLLVYISIKDILLFYMREKSYDIY